MTNQEQLNILKQGTTTWNAWRERNRHISIGLNEANLSRADLSEADLSEANLSGAYLIGADLSKANLSEADLIGTYLNEANLSRADLSGADLSKANLSGADLIRADLIRADLSEANLSEAILMGTDLSGADLSKANLSGAYLSGADLSEANLSEADLIGTYLFKANLFKANLFEANLFEAITYQTIFHDLDLRPAKGLETIKHRGPSGITTSTLQRSQGDIPEIFLKGAGLSDAFISYAHSLVHSPIKYYSCFLSYSSNDQEFAERLYVDLQQHSIRCWFAPHSLKIGDHFPRHIEEAIRTYEKLLVILSESSVESEWVEDEVRAALEKEARFQKEQQQERTVLFPIQIDATIEHASTQWATKLRRTRHIGNFTTWKDRDSYLKSFQRLLHDLKAEPSTPKE